MIGNPTYFALTLQTMFEWRLQLGGCFLRKVKFFELCHLRTQAQNGFILHHSCVSQGRKLCNDILHTDYFDQFKVNVCFKLKMEYF